MINIRYDSNFDFVNLKDKLPIIKETDDYIEYDDFILIIDDKKHINYLHSTFNLFNDAKYYKWLESELDSLLEFREKQWITSDRQIICQNIFCISSIQIKISKKYCGLNVFIRSSDLNNFFENDVKFLCHYAYKTFPINKNIKIKIFNSIPHIYLNNKTKVDQVSL